MVPRLNKCDLVKLAKSSPLVPRASLVINHTGHTPGRLDLDPPMESSARLKVPRFIQHFHVSCFNSFSTSSWASAIAASLYESLLPVLGAMMMAADMDGLMFNTSETMRRAELRFVKNFWPRTSNRTIRTV